ncbi:MAG: 4Fe-4S dicluster domain-containing protein [Anaerolineae bacterium]
MSEPKKKRTVKLELTRRDFLTLAATAAGSAVGAQVLTTGALSPFSGLKQRQVTGAEHTEKATSPYHWGMLIDLDKCIGCEYCQRSCSATNDVADDKPWNIVVEDKLENGQKFFFTRPCLHCQDAPCVEVCPVQATYHREDGLVVMDYSRCIGCRYCEVACPYDARKFNWKERTDTNPYEPTWGVAEVERRPRGVVEKCTFCIQRIDYGLAHNLMPGEDREATPACVNACPVGARVFGNLKDENSKVSRMIKANPTIRLREELGTEPSVYYIPAKKEA